MPTIPPPGHAVTDLRDLWLPVTVQVAWTLVKRGYTVTPELLSDAREHLLRGVDLTLPVDAIEWLAKPWTLDYLARRVDRTVAVPPKSGPELSIPAAAWRAELDEQIDRAMEAVLRLVYAEGLSIKKAAHHLRCRPELLVKARRRLRAYLTERLLGYEGWSGTPPEAVLDTMLQRLASLAAPGGPGPLGLMSPAGLAHAETCPRTNRAIRLIRRGHLTPQALLLPRGTRHPASGSVVVVGLHLHPDAHRHAGPIRAFLEGRSMQPAPGTWLLPEEVETDLYERLSSLAIKGQPARHHVRATRIQGSGRWSGRTLLGPVANGAVEATRAVPWGNICGRPALPLPAPPLPSAHTWWVAAVVAAAATILLGVQAARPEAVSSPTPIEASFKPQDQGWEVSFDVPDNAVIDVVSVEGAEVRIVHRSMRSARGAWATGYGRFKARIPGESVAFLASPSGIHDLERLVLEASEHVDPLAVLSASIDQSHPRADYVRSPAVVATASVAEPASSQL
ncbi:MAG: hypothetical protein CL927_16500 [Deltaproteobacteria bacterium]|nr:hypothetical protein [Deltaproteobacteria bacterium]HCH61763.1 hypothetical protein [Deltaproteobacteria bacterium]